MTGAPKYILRWSAQAERNVDDIADGIARQSHHQPAEGRLAGEPALGAGFE